MKGNHRVGRTKRFTVGFSCGRNHCRLGPRGVGERAKRFYVSATRIVEIDPQGGWMTGDKFNGVHIKQIIDMLT
jgi:hypothetical protein